MNFKKQIQARLDNLTKPRKSLGDLEDIALKMALIQNKLNPSIKHKATIVFAADHGVVKHCVSAYPKEVTAQMVLNFLNNGAAVNVLSDYVNAKVFVVDAGVDFDFKKNSGIIINKTMNGTNDLYLEKSMPVAAAKKNIELGKSITSRIIKKHKINLIALGEMGIGNTTAATILIGHICNLNAKIITGRGTGINDASFKVKQKIIDAVLKRIKNINNPYKLLNEAGGLEIAQLAGAILACAENRVAVVIDGLICTSAALISYLINKKVVNYMFAGHKSIEPAHIFSLKKLGLKPMLDLNMRLGEGTGAVLGMCIIEASLKILNEMATFENAGVSKGT